MVKYFLIKYLVLLLSISSLFAADSKLPEEGRGLAPLPLLAAPSPSVSSFVITGNLNAVRHKSFLWKNSLDYYYVPNSEKVLVNPWHHVLGLVVEEIQKPIKDLMQAKRRRVDSNTNVAIGGVSYVFRQGDMFKVSPIFTLPKIFTSGYLTSSDLLLAEHVENIDVKVRSKIHPDYHSFLSQIMNGLRTSHTYSLGTCFGHDPEFREAHEHLTQNFRLWIGENSQLSNQKVREKHRIIDQRAANLGQFCARFFHSEQAILAFLGSRDGMVFLRNSIMNLEAPSQSWSGSSSQLVHITLHISSVLDVCEDCCDTLFRESEVGRLFLNKLQDDLRSYHYMQPHSKVTLSIVTSGNKVYNDSRARENTENPFVCVPIVVTHPSHYVLRSSATNLIC